MFPFRDCDGNMHRTKESRDKHDAAVAKKIAREGLRARLERIERKLDRLLRLNDRT